MSKRGAKPLVKHLAGYHRFWGQVSTWPTKNNRESWERAKDGAFELVTCLCYGNTLCGQEQWMGTALPVRRLVRARNLWVCFLFYTFQCCLFFFLGLFPRAPQRSALLVLLFYYGTPRCCLVSSVPTDLPLFRYLLHFTTATDASYCGCFSPIGSSFLEPALIPLWSPLQSSNHTIYTVPLTVTSL